ncbi:MAG: prolipoprotein diacylglyceryl transferase, partial [Pseudothermotoga sp.]
VVDQLDELIFYAVIFGIVGARLFYVIFNLRYYTKNPIEIFMVWHGGLAIQGAVLFAIVTCVVYARYRKGVSFTTFQVLDLGAAYLPLGQAIGRWGNFFNYEAFGGPTNLPWKMYVPLRFRPVGYLQYEYFHPTFLYESIWDLLIFFLLTRYMSKNRKNFGEVFALYLCFYSLGRICIERLRLDSLYLGNLRSAQLFSAIMIAVGFVLFVQRRGDLN